METVKTYLFISDLEPGLPRLVDTIWHEGHWWLVAKWLRPHDGSEDIPQRLVRLDEMQPQEIEGQPFRFLLPQPIPRSVFEQTSPAGYVVALHPAALSHTRGPRGIQ